MVGKEWGPKKKKKGEKDWASGIRNLSGTWLLSVHEMLESFNLEFGFLWLEDYENLLCWICSDRIMLNKLV